MGDRGIFEHIYQSFLDITIIIHCFFRDIFMRTDNHLKSVALSSKINASVRPKGLNPQFVNRLSKTAEGPLSGSDENYNSRSEGFGISLVSISKEKSKVDSNEVKNLFWKNVSYPSVSPIEAYKLENAGKRLKNARGDLPPVRDFSDPIYNAFANLYYRTTDAKEKVAFIIKSFILPNLAQRHNLRFIGIGSGEGSFCAKILGRINDHDYSRQVFNDATFIEKSTKAIAQSKRFLYVKFFQSDCFFYYNNIEQYRNLTPDNFLETGLIDTRKLLINKSMVTGKQKIPLNHDFIAMKFPNKDIETQRADVVLLNHMLHYNKYKDWVKISKEAFKLVAPGGALIILLHELNHATDGKDERSLGYFLKKLGGRTENINQFAIDVAPILRSAGATKLERLIVETKNFLTDEKCAEDIIKFLLTGKNLELINQNEDELRQFIKDQHMTDTNKGYEILKADKIIVAYKRAN